MEKIDETDLKILRILQKDSKKTTKEIAKILNLTSSPVYERIKRLEKQKLIKKYVALVDKKKLNIPITAICMVSLRYHHEGFIDKFDRQIKLAKKKKSIVACLIEQGKLEKSKNMKKNLTQRFFS